MDPLTASPFETSTPESHVDGPGDPQFSAAAKAFDRFLNSLATLASGQLYLPVEVLPASARQGGLAAALEGDGQDGCVVPLDLKPFPGMAYLAFGRAFVGSTLEILLGAPLAFAGEPRAFLTELDLQVLDGVVDSAVSELQRAWLPVSNAAFARATTELGGELPRAGADGERVVILSAEIRVNGRP